MIARRLKMLLPMTVPTATWVWRFVAATSVVASSGSDVPTATIVKPTTVSATPSWPATSTAAAIRRLAPIGRPIAPATMNRPIIHAVDGRPSTASITAARSAS